MVNAQRLSTKEPYSIVDKVQLIDLEDACYMPEGPIVTRKLTGHDDWRSPEAYLRSRVNTSADMFSFGIVVSKSPFVLLIRIHSIDTLF